MSIPFVDYENQSFKISVPDYMTDTNNANSFRTNRSKHRKASIHNIVVLELDEENYSTYKLHLASLGSATNKKEQDQMLIQREVGFGVKGYEVFALSTNPHTKKKY